MRKGFEKFIESNIIDKYLKCRKIIDKETEEEYYEKYIQLNKIDALGLNDDELDYVFRYLEKQNINIHGSCQCYVGEYDSYKFVSKVYCFTGKNSICNSEEKIREYQETKDINIRNDIVVANLKLVKFLANKYSQVFKIEPTILESYGYEGLIESIDKVDLSKGKLSVYMAYYIKYKIMDGALFETLGTGGRLFLDHLSHKNDTINSLDYFLTLSKVEQVEQKSIKDNPDMIGMVISILREKWDCDSKKMEILENRIFEKNHYSLEQLDEDLVYIDDDSLYKKTIEVKFRQELKELLDGFIEQLSEMQKHAIKNYIETEATLKEVGARVGVKSETLRRRTISGLGKMRTILKSYKNADVVKSFLENNNHEYSNNPTTAYIKKNK